MASRPTIDTDINATTFIRFHVRSSRNLAVLLFGSMVNLTVTINQQTQSSR